MVRESRSVIITHTHLLSNMCSVDTHCLAHISGSSHFLFPLPIVELCQKILSNQRHVYTLIYTHTVGINACMQAHTHTHTHTHAHAQTNQICVSALIKHLFMGGILM